MTAAVISGFKIRRGDGGSPETYTDIAEVLDVDGVGQTNAQIDVTNFDSPAGQREFIAGLSEGNDVTFSCNWIPNNTTQEGMMAAVSAGTNGNYRVAYTLVSPELVMTFVGTPLAWELDPSAEDQNRVNFTVKISSITANDFDG